MRSPRQTPLELEARIVALRRARPDWGARKLALLLEREGMRMPAITVYRVLDRESRRQATGRSERERPDELWEMDFKGQKRSEAKIGPLSVLDHNCYLGAPEQTGSTGGEVVREPGGGVRQPRPARCDADGSWGSVVERARLAGLHEAAGVAGEAGAALLSFPASAIRRRRAR